MSTLNGLPAHILLVHAVVVLLPLVAGLLVLAVLRSSLRRRWSGLTALLAVVTAALVPVTTGAGEWLQARVEATDAVRDHVELGDTAIYVAVPLAVVALVVWWRGREVDALAAAGATAGATAATRLRHGAADAVPAAAATVTRPRTFLAPASRAVGTVVTVLAVLVSLGAVYDVYLIGDSGAKASWQDGFSPTPLPGSPQGG